MPFAQVSALVIDDQAPRRKLLESVLKAAGVGRVLTAGDVSAAVQILTAPQAAIDCVLCAQDMAVMSGLALLQRVRAGRNSVVPRDLRFILVTDEASEVLVQGAIRFDVTGFLLEPFTTDTVTKALVYAFNRDVLLKSPGYYAKTDVPAA